MESLGEKLKTARELKDLSFEQVSRETNIASRYLQALEAEDFSGFPGEPYIFGFLKNYGAYLALDVPELLSLYRALKIQEQPIPVEQLLKNPSPLPRVIAAVVIVLVILAAGGGIFLFARFSQKNTAETPAVRTPVEYTLAAGSLERRFYEGDSLLVTAGANQYKLELSNLGETVTITTPSGELRLDLSQRVNVDINNDGITELHITAADFEKNKRETGALLRFESSAADTVLVPALAESISPLGPNDSSLSAAAVIFSSPQAYPFTLQSNFQGYCMFRWEILFERDRRDRNEQYFQRGNELNIQAQNGIRVWVSNAQAAKVQVIGGGRTVPLELGGAGEVVVADVRWVRDDENRYRLVFARLE